MATLQPTRGARRSMTASMTATAEDVAPRRTGVVRKRASRLMFVGVMLLSVAALGIFQVLQSSQVASAGYQLRALELERAQLSAEVRLLEAEIARQSNLDLLQAEAEERLGMGPPEERMRIDADTLAPRAIPLPRRYVEEPKPAPLPEPGRWEQLFGTLLGVE